MCGIKPTTCMISYEFYVTSQPIFMTSQDCTHDITSTQFMTSHPLYMTWYTLYLGHHSHCNYDKTPTIFMALYALYMISHPWFMTSEHSIHYISLLYLISKWLYFTAHPLYLCHHTQITDHITFIVCMITQVKYAWHHMNAYDITYTL